MRDLCHDVNEGSVLSQISWMLLSKVQQRRNIRLSSYLCWLINVLRSKPSLQTQDLCMDIRSDTSDSVNNSKSTLNIVSAQAQIVATKPKQRNSLIDPHLYLSLQYKLHLLHQRSAHTDFYGFVTALLHIMWLVLC